MVGWLMTTAIAREPALRGGLRGAAVCSPDPRGGEHVAAAGRNADVGEARSTGSNAFEAQRIIGC